MSEKTCNCAPDCADGCACQPPAVSGVKKLQLYRNMGGERYLIHPETDADQVVLGDGSRLQTRLNTFESVIGDVATARHEHANKPLLDGLSLYQGHLCVNGELVCKDEVDVVVINKGEVPPANLRDGGILLVTE